MQKLAPQTKKYKLYDKFYQISSKEIN